MAAGRRPEDQLEGLRLELISRPTIKRAHDSAAQTYGCRYVSPVCAQGWHSPPRPRIAVGHAGMLTRKDKKGKKEMPPSVSAKFDPFGSKSSSLSDRRRSRRAELAYT